MKKIAIVVLLVLFISGCGVIENSLVDINGWDLSACVDGHEVCWELFWDNSDRLLGEEVITQGLSR